MPPLAAVAAGARQAGSMPGASDNRRMRLRQNLATRRAWLALALGIAARSKAEESGFEWRPWPKAKPVPPLDLASALGPPFTLAGQRGRVVLLNFWATWCEPCRAELPSLQRLAQSRDDLAVVTVNQRETLDTVRRFVRTLPLALPVLLDADGAAAKSWTPRIFPSTVCIRRNGRPAGTVVGEIDWQSAAAQALLEPLLAEPR